MLRKIFYWLFNLGVKTAYAKDHTVQENIDRYHRIGESFAKHGFMPYNNAIINIMEISGADATTARQMLETRTIPPEYATKRSTIRDATGLRRFSNQDPYAPGGGPGQSTGGTTTPSPTTPTYQQPRTSVGAETGGSNVSQYQSGGSTASQRNYQDIPGRQMGADGREFRPPRASGAQRINPNYGRYERGNEQELDDIIRRWRNGQMQGAAAVSAINRLTGWGRNRANELLLYHPVSGTNTGPLQAHQAGGGTPFGTQGAGITGISGAQGIQGEFGEVPGRTLEDIFGTGTARNAQFGQAMDQQFGNVSPNFRDIIARQGPLASNAFELSGLLGGGTDFGEFLKNIGQNQWGFNAVPSRDVLNQAADRLRTAPSLVGEDPTNPTPWKLLAEQLRGDQLAQLSMATQGGINKLPVRFQGTASDLTRRAFDNILANQPETAAGAGSFQFLPYLQSQGWQF